MMNLKKKLFAGAFAFLALSQSQVFAGWNNVYQATCFNKSNTSTSNYQPAPVAASPCPTPACVQQNCSPCTTRYVQKFYYEPVTTYEQTSYYEPVTTYKTSYYYEPVTSYKTSYYYDPCSCGYQTVNTPVTSYSLKAQNCPVTSYVLRTAAKPVTSYKQSYYYEPQTTCSTTTVGAPIFPQTAAPCNTCPTPVGAPTPAPAMAPGVQEQKAVPTPAPAAAAPGVSESISPNPSTINSGVRGTGIVPAQPVAPNWNNPAPLAQPKAPQQSPVKLDRIVSISSSNNVEGVVVHANMKPANGAKLILVHESISGMKTSVSTDAQGRFGTNLQAGSWLVYLADAQGRAVFQKQIEVKPAGAQTIQLVSR